MTTARKPDITSIRNHLAPAIRLRKGMIGAAFIVLTFLLLFGPRWEGDSSILAALNLIVAFLAFGFGWAGFSQGLMGWSRQIDIDFDKLEVRQVSATMMGRSKPFVLPFAKIAQFEVRTGAVKGEGGEKEEATIELQDKTGHAIIRAGMFDSKADADAMVRRMAQAQSRAAQQAGRQR